MIVSPRTVTVGKDGGVARYSIRLISDPGGTVAITPASSDAAKATVSGAVLFTSSNWNTLMPVTVTGSTNIGTATVSHTVSTGNTSYPTSTSVDSVAVTVVADTRPTVVLSVSSNTLNEGDTLTVTATLSAVVSKNRPLSIPLTYTDGTASGGTDYGIQNFISIAPGATSGTTKVAISTDNADEQNETFTVQFGTLPAAIRGGATVSQEVTIRDDNPTTVYLTRSGSGAIDAGEVVRFVVSLSRRLGAGEEIVVPLAVSGTGVTSSDWSLATKAGNSINKGVNTSTSKVRFRGHDTDIVDTAILELRTNSSLGDKTVTVALDTNTNFDAESGTNVGGGAKRHKTTNSFSVAVNRTPGIVLSARTLALTELHATSASGTYTVKLNTNPGVDTTVTIMVPSAERNAVTVQKSGGTAGHTVSLVFTSTNWNRAQTVTVAAINDADDANETAVITHSVSAANGDYSSLTITDTMTVSVTDAGHGVILSPKTLSVVTNGQTATYTIRLQSDPGGTVTITPTSSDSTKVAVSGAVSFTSSTWSTGQTVTVTRGTVSGSVVISHAVTTGTTDYPTSTTVDSVDVSDDPRPTVDLSVDSNTVTEGGNLTVTATLLAAVVPNKKVSIPLTYTDDTARGRVDYVPQRSISIASGGTTGTVKVPISKDSADEGDEKFTVQLGTLAANSLVRVGTTVSQEVTIRDSNPTVVSLARTGARSVGAGVPVEFTVSLGRNLGDGETIVVPLVVSGTGVSSSDWSLAEKAGSSINQGVGLASAKVTFTGDDANTVQVATLELTPASTAVGKTLTIALGTNANFDAESTTNVSGGADPHRTRNSFSVAIQKPPGIELTPTTLSLTELHASQASGTFQVKLDTNPKVNATVTVTVPASDRGEVTVQKSGGTAGNTVSLTFTSSNWNNAQTVTVAAVNDGDTSNETAVIGFAVSAASGDYRALAISDTVTVSVADASHGVSVSTSTLTVVTNETAKYTIRLKSDPGGTVAITPASGDSTKATVSGAVSFTSSNWSTAQEVTVSGGTSTGSVTVSHAVTTGTTNYPTSTSVGSVTVTVTDDPRPTVNLSVDSNTVTEGNNLTVTATLSAAVTPNSAVAIPLTYTAGSATSGTDYTRRNSISIVSGGTTGRATVPIVSDRADESDETFTVQLGTLPAKVRAGATTSQTVSIRDNNATVVSITRAERNSISDIVEGDTIEFQVTLSRNLGATEVIDVPMAISGTGITTGDWSLAKKAGNSINLGVSLSGQSTATPKVTFTGHGTNTVKVATLILTATADNTAEAGGETLTVALGPDGTGTNGFDVSTLGTNVSGGANPHASNKSFAVKVADPSTPELSVSFATAVADEGDEGVQTRTVTVKLSNRSNAQVGFKLCVSDESTATYGTDYQLFASGSEATLDNNNCVTGSFAANANAPDRFNPYQVRVLSDTTVEPDETVVLTLSRNNTPQGVSISATENEATHTIRNDDAEGLSPEAKEQVQATVKDTLAKVASQSLSQVQVQVEARFAAPQISTQLTLAGYPIGTTQSGEPIDLVNRCTDQSVHRRNADESCITVQRADVTQETLLSQSEFSINLDGDSSANALSPKWAVWGRGSIDSFKGQSKKQKSTYDGKIRTAWLGVDVRTDTQVSGLAVSFGKGESEYKVPDASNGNLEFKLRAVYPYASWTVRDGLELQAMAGVGKGELRHKFSTEDEWTTSDLKMVLGSVGVRQDLLPIGGFDASFRADASFSHLKTDSGDTVISGIKAKTWKLRAGIEGERTQVLDNGSQSTPFWELMARQDGGDGLTGTGLEAAGGVRYKANRLELEARARVLAAHSQSKTREYGASLGFRYEPKAQGEGLSFELTPRWGASSNSTKVLWGNDDLPEQQDDNLNAALDAKVGYGFYVARYGGILTPAAEFGLVSGQSQKYRFGTRFNTRHQDHDLETSLWLERSESKNERKPDDALRFDFKIYY